jgi:hypothetical protein
MPSDARRASDATAFSPLRLEKVLTESVPRNWLRCGESAFTAAADNVKFSVSGSSVYVAMDASIGAAV